MNKAQSIAAALLAVAACVAAIAASSPMQKGMAAVDGATFESALPIAPGQSRATVRSFRLDTTPVTNSEFAEFLKSNPQWRRDRIAKLLGDSEYLVHWSDASTPGEAIARQPVTRVSWYAARAYCKSRNARLPTWHEWEWAAAASATLADARKDEAWRQQILQWYSHPSGALPDVGLTPPNRYGIRDLHGVIWEWVEDFNGMLVSAESSSLGDADATRFCGSGALSMEQKDQYAIMMRIAMLSSLKAKYTTTSLGFRCAADVPGGAQ